MTSGPVVRGRRRGTRARGIPRSSIVVISTLVFAGGLLYGIGQTERPAAPGVPLAPELLRLLIVVTRSGSLVAGTLVVGCGLVVLMGAARPGAREAATLASTRLSVAWSALLLLTLWLQAGEAYARVAGPAEVVDYVAGVTSGRALLTAAIIAGVVAARGVRGARDWLLPLAGLLVVPMTGHASQSRPAALGELLLVAHLGAVVAWVGGLAALVIIVGHRSDGFEILAARFSRVATVAVPLVLLSGVGLGVQRATGQFRPGQAVLWDRLLGTGAGHLLLGKSAILVVLVGTGAVLRQRIVPGLRPGNTRTFAAWAAAELVLMSAAMALACVLARPL